MDECAAQETCHIVIEGSEVAELKRHAHQIPECPGLGRRIQRHDGNKPLEVSLDELGWLVAVLDAVLHDDRLAQESGRRFEVAMKKRNEARKPRRQGLPVCRAPALEARIRSTHRRAMRGMSAALRRGQDDQKTQ